VRARERKRRWFILTCDSERVLPVTIFCVRLEVEVSRLCGAGRRR
jgi:hypothetical protein